MERTYHSRLLVLMKGSLKMTLDQNGEKTTSNEKSKICHLLHKYKERSKLSNCRNKNQLIESYPQRVVQKILQEANVKGLMLPHDKVPSNRTRLTLEFVEQNPIKVLK